MQMVRLNPRAALLAVVALTVAACGGTTSASLSPLGPSGAGAVPTAGASITGTVLGDPGPAASLMAFDAGAPAVSAAAPEAAPAVSITVSLVGTGEAQEVGPDGTFVFEDVPPGTIELRFTGPGIDARAVITIESDEDVRVEVHVSGPDADLQVTDRRRKPKMEIEGLIAAVDEVAQTIEVNGQVIGITETTLIRHGNRTFAFADLAVGDRVHVRGALDAETGLVVAREVKLQSAAGGNGSSDDDDETDDGEDDDDGHKPPRVHSVELDGLVSGLEGACPALTFEVQATVVTTDTDTTFRGGTCADLVDGASVEVKGTVAEDGTVTVTRVKIQSANGDDDEDDDSTGGGQGGHGHGHGGESD